MTQGDSPELHVVFICTGNRFRSPLAAAIFGDAAAKHGVPVTVESVGTLDTGSPPAFPETIEHAERFGLDISDHRARHALAVDLTGADVVIGFERTHVAFAIVDAGVPAEKAFTLPELVQLLELEDVPVRRPDAAAGSAAGDRPGEREARCARADAGQSGDRRSGNGSSPCVGTGGRRDPRPRRPARARALQLARRV